MKRRRRLFKWGILLLTTLLLIVGISSLFDHGHRRGGFAANGRMVQDQYANTHQNFQSRDGQAGFQRGTNQFAGSHNVQQFRNNHHAGSWLGGIAAFLVTLILLPLLIPFIGLVIAIVLIILLMKRLRRQRPRWLSGRAFVAHDEMTATTYNAGANDFLDQWEKETRAKLNRDDQ